MQPAIMKAEIESGLIHTLISKPRIRQQKYLVAYQAERRGSGIDTIIRLTKDLLTRSGVLVPRRAADGG